MVSQETHNRIKELMNRGINTDEDKAEYQRLKSQAQTETAAGISYYDKAIREYQKEDTIQEKYDEPQEIRQAIQETPKQGGGVWGWVKRGFKSQEEYEISQDAKEVERETYRTERRNYKISQAKERAKQRAREGPLWFLNAGNGTARAVKGFVKPYKVKRQQQYVIKGGRAYPIVRERTSRTPIQTPFPRETFVSPQKRNLDDLLMGNAYTIGNRGYNNPLDMLSQGSIPKRKGKLRNPLDMLMGGL